MLGIVAWILLFMFLVLIHELGHYIAARKSGVKVLEFGIGIPPKVCTLRKDKHGTSYTLNRIPLGGFVRMNGEQPDDEGVGAGDSFLQANIRRKLLILVAGVAVNMLFAWMAFSLAFRKGVPPLFVVPDNMLSYESRSYLLPTVGFLEKEWFLSGTALQGDVLIEGVTDGGIAQKAGITAGDRFVSVDGKAVDALTLSRQLKEYTGKTFPLSYVRAWMTWEVQITCPEDNCFLGVSLSGNATQELLPIKFGFRRAWWAGAHEVVEQSRVTFIMLGSLLENLVSWNKAKMSAAVGKMSWPVGIVKFGETVFTQWWPWLYLAFAGMISLALAVFNILPIPALDGWRALSAIIQSVGRFKPSTYFTVEQYINLIFFVLLMGMGIFIILQDLDRFRGVHIW